MAIKLKPLGSRLVVEPIEQEDVTASGIVLPETAKEKPQRGKVLAAGPGDRDDAGKRIELDVKVGDVVLYAKSSGTEIKVDGQKLLILKESDVLALVE
jgi:chaperonin GroES